MSLKGAGKKQRRSGLPPGPRTPAVTHTFSWAVRPLPFMENCRARYGNIFSMKMAGSGTWVVIADPGELKRVFMGDSDVLRTSEGNIVMRPVMGWHSVFMLDGDEHLRRRKLVLPAFHGERMQRYADVVSEATRKETASWPIGEPFTLWPSMRSITLRVIIHAVFGVTEPERVQTMEKALGTLIDWVGNARSLARVIYFPVEWTERNRTFRAMMDPVDEVLIEEIRRRRGASDIGEREDILSTLLQARYEDGSGMSDEDVRDELKGLLLAGHDTTASGLSWAFERLLRHEDKLERLREEVLAGEDDTYMEAVIKETLRTRPVIPITPPRVLAAPMEIGGYTIPAGAKLIPALCLVHSDPELYPDPQSFRPERFLEGTPAPYTNVPFGGGVRRCLGAAFAQFEMKRVMGLLLREVDLRVIDPTPETPKRRSLTLTPHHGTRVVMTGRRAGASADPAPVPAPA